jgi:hypothetical protein
MEPSEIMGKIQRHDHDACPEDEHMSRTAQIEATDTTDEQVADGKIEEAP